MSAYICDDSVFATLGAFAALAFDLDAQQAADVLAAENVRSVNYRYNEATAPAPVDLAQAEQAPDRATLLALCAEYDYQSCERPDYSDTAAGQLLQRIRSAAVAHVPGDTTQHQPGELIGAPVYRDRHGHGYVVGVSESAHASYTLGAGGMQRESSTRLDVVWLPREPGQDMRRSDVALSTAKPWLESPYNWPPITPAQAERLAADQMMEQNDRMRALELERQERERAALAWRDQVAAVMPADCRGVIVARLEVSECDSMTDYFASKTARSIVLAFSSHNRNNFAEMRKAIAAADLSDLPELAALADPEQSEECRENWSMGKGYYLQARGASSYSGWKVQKIRAWKDGTLSPDAVPVGELRLPGTAKEEPEPPASGAVLTINEELDGVELVFPDKPAPSVRDRLKAAGFRWSRRGYWYAKRTAERLALAQCIAQGAL